MAYLSEHTWYITFRRQSVLVWWGLSCPLDLYQKELGWLLRKTQTGDTHRSTCPQTIPHWDKGQPEKKQRATGESRGYRQMSEELSLGWLRIQMKVAPTLVHPPPAVPEKCWDGPGRVTERCLDWIKESHSGMATRFPEWSKCIFQEGWTSNSHKVADSNGTWPSLVRGANIKRFTEVLTGCLQTSAADCYFSWPAPLGQWLHSAPWEAAGVPPWVRHFGVPLNDCVGRLVGAVSWCVHTILHYVYCDQAFTTCVAFNWLGPQPRSLWFTVLLNSETTEHSSAVTHSCLAF